MTSIPPFPYLPPYLCLILHREINIKWVPGMEGLEFTTFSPNRELIKFHPKKLYTTIWRLENI